MIKYTLQSAFDEIWYHFVVEKASASFQSGSCKYNGPNGTVCAFALLVPAEMRHLLTQYESKSGGYIVQVNPDIAALFEDDVLENVDNLQSLHDKAAIDYTSIEPLKTFHELIEKYMREFAEKRGLVIP